MDYLQAKRFHRKFIIKSIVLQIPNNKLNSLSFSANDSDSILISFGLSILKQNFSFPSSFDSEIIGMLKVSKLKSMGELICQLNHSIVIIGYGLIVLASLMSGKKGENNILKWKFHTSKAKRRAY